MTRCQYARRYLMLCACGLVFTACAQQFGGKRADTIRAAEKSFTQKGWASWYGGRFQGRRTASGERFNATAMTAAHRTLPFGTTVTVTHMETGKTVVVRINDRGPFMARRVIDLSRAAAQRLGMIGAGVAKVKLRVVTSPKRHETDDEG